MEANGKKTPWSDAKVSAEELEKSFSEEKIKKTFCLETSFYLSSKTHYR